MQHIASVDYKRVLYNYLHFYGWGNCVMQEEVTCRSSWSVAELGNEFWTLRSTTVNSIVQFPSLLYIV